MAYCKDYCEEKGISTSKLNEAQKTLYYIAENMRLSRSINEEGYKHFQMAIKALEQESVLDKIKAEIEQMDFDFGDFYDNTNTIIEMVLGVIDKYKAETESKE